MTFDELSLMAFRNDPLPRFVKLHEMAAYFGLQNIYWSYEYRFISKDQAAKRKKELQYRFDDDGTKKLWVDCSNSLHHCKDNHYCNYGERKESNE